MKQFFFVLSFFCAAFVANAQIDPNGVNNLLVTATPATFPGSITDQMDGTDVDYFTYTIPSCGLAIFSISGVSVDANLTFNAYSAPNTNALIHGITWNVQSSSNLEIVGNPGSTIYLLVDQTSNTGVALGSYTINATLNNQDASECNNSNAEAAANPEPLNTTFESYLRGYLYGNNYAANTPDREIYAVNVTQAGVLRVNITGVNANQRLVVNVSNSASVTINARVASGNGSNVNFSTLLPVGTYYIRITEFTNSTSPYQLADDPFTVSFSFDTSDVAEPNNTFSTAFPIPLNTTFDAKLYGENEIITEYSELYIDYDVDYYRITTTTTDTFRINIVGINSNQRLIIAMFNNQLNSIGSATASSNGANVSFATLLTPGTYYIRLTEHNSNEYFLANDPFTVTVSFGNGINTAPDLIGVDGATSTPSLLPGATATFTHKVRNQGTGSAGVSTSRYFWSNNPTYETNDLLIPGSDAVVALAPGVTSNTETHNYVVPAGTPTGTYYILVKVDRNNQVIEADENNNFIAIAINVASANSLSDLIVVNGTTSTPSLQPGATATFTHFVQNQGIVSAGASTSNYYWSTNATYETSDVSIPGNDPVAALAAGAISPIKTHSFVIPTGTAPGTYFIIVRADNNQVINESNENNNTFAIAITVTGTTSGSCPDLTIQNATVSSMITAGAQFGVMFNVRNIGTVPAPVTASRVYLSSNNTYEPSDVCIGGTHTIVIPANTIEDEAELLAMPAGTAPGSFFLIFRADAANEINNECDEINNIQVVAITVSAFAGGDQNVNLAVSPDNGLQNTEAESQQEKAFGIYPNPASGTVTISSTEALIDQLIIFDALGKKVCEWQSVANAEKVDIQHLPAGVYYVMACGAGKAPITTQLIVE